MKISFDFLILINSLNTAGLGYILRGSCRCFGTVILGVCLFKITLRYNPCIIKFTLLKYRLKWFLVYSESCSHPQYLMLEHFHYSVKKSLISWQSLPDSPHLLETTLLLCLFSLFWVFHINGIS